MTIECLYYIVKIFREIGDIVVAAYCQRRGGSVEHKIAVEGDAACVRGKDSEVFALAQRRRDGCLYLFRSGNCQF